MGSFDLAAYFMTVVAVNAAPGPLIATVVARALGNDAAGAVWYSAGIALGDVVAVMAVYLGLGLWMTAMPHVFLVGKTLAVGYILWLAIGLWRAQTEAAGGGAVLRMRPWPSVLAGTATCLASPHTLVFYLALLPAVLTLEQVSPAALGMVISVTVAATAGVFLSAILIAGRARRMLACPQTTRLTNRLLALTMAGAALWMAAA